MDKSEETLELYGKVCIEMNDIVGATESYRKALEIASDNVDILTSLGLLYLQTGSHQQAFEVVGRALSYDRCHVPSIIAAASMIQSFGDYDVALNKYRYVTIKAVE